LPSGVRPPPSATFVLGPFGEVVTYGDGIIYLTWYPECLQAISTDVTPPDWETYPAEPLRSRIIGGTLRALSAIVPSLCNDSRPRWCALRAERLPPSYRETFAEIRHRRLPAPRLQRVCQIRDAQQRRTQAAHTFPKNSASQACRETSRPAQRRQSH